MILQVGSFGPQTSVHPTSARRPYMWVFSIPRYYIQEMERDKKKTEVFEVFLGHVLPADMGIQGDFSRISPEEILMKGVFIAHHCPVKRPCFKGGSSA